jgi:Pyridoxamine 5'-phosphate oxidase
LIEPEVAELLESPCSLLVGTVASDGLPDAVRGWGLTLLAPDRVRVLLAADAARTHANLAGGGRMALTATDFVLMTSWQLKGQATTVEPATPADRITFDRFCAGCLAILAPLHAVPEERIARLTPADVVACELVVEQVFDQTPGPGAGARVAPEPV